MTIRATIDDIPARRRWRRYHIAAPVRVRIEKPLRTLLDTRAYEMNDGGMAIHTDAELSIGTRAKIQFAPPSFEFPLTLRGMVCNRAGKQYGVEFLATSAEEKEHLILFQEILHTIAERLDA